MTGSMAASRAIARRRISRSSDLHERVRDRGPVVFGHNTGEDRPRHVELHRNYGPGFLRDAEPQLCRVSRHGAGSSSYIAAIRLFDDSYDLERLTRAALQHD